MTRAERHAAILERLAAHGSVDARRLVAELGAGAATIRRDLDVLQDQALLERTHGGAVSLPGLLELPMRYRGAVRRDAKRRVAAAAVALVAPEASVALSGGTTTTEAARLLATRERLTVVTNAINIAAELAIRPNVRLVLSGGLAEPATYELVGPLADEVLAQLSVEVALIGCDGIEARAGLTAARDVDARTTAVLASRATRVVAVADGSKVGRRGLARICGVEAIDALVTTGDAPPGALDALREAGVEVLVA